MTGNTARVTEKVAKTVLKRPLATKQLRKNGEETLHVLFIAFIILFYFLFLITFFLQFSLLTAHTYAQNLIVGQLPLINFKPQNHTVRLGRPWFY